MLVIISLSSGSKMENIEKIFYMMDFDKDGMITSEVILETDNEISTYFIPKCISRNINW